MRLPVGPRFRNQPRDASKQISRSRRRGPSKCDTTAVADDRRADFYERLLPCIAESERVAGFIPIGHADDLRGGRSRPLRANIAT